MCQKNTRHTFRKIKNILQNEGYGWNFVMNFLVVIDIDVYQLNFKPLKKQLVENPLKKGIFFFIFEQYMHNKLLFLVKKNYLKEKKRFYSWALYFFSIFFGLVMCHEPQT